MELLDLTAELSSRGLALRVFGCDSLEVAGPIAELTPTLEDAIRQHKATLLAAVGSVTGHAVDNVEFFEILNRWGEVVGGSAGDQLIEEANHWMTREWISDPDAFTGVLAPKLRARELRG